MKFTDRFLQSLKPGEKEYCIREGHGFTIRVLPTGIKTFQYIYFLNGKRKRLGLGSYPFISLAEAREKFLEAATLVCKGLDPQQPPPPSPEFYTVSKLIEDYLIHAEANLSKSFFKIVRLTLNNDVLPVWGRRLTENIRRRDAIELVESVASRAPGQGRNVLKIARTMFTFALHRERVDFNPFSGVSTAVPSVAANDRDRVLSNDEIKHVWHCLYNKVGIGTHETRIALLLILVTAQRPGEVVGMSAAEVSDNWWTISSDRTKNNEEHRVFLPPLALRLLPNLFCPWYFPAPTLAGPIGRPSLSHILSQTPKDKSGNSIRLPYLGLSRWTPHDLRRTAATKMSELGASDEIVDAILNHRKKGVIGIYNRNKYDNEKQIWLTKWANHLEKLTM